VVGHLDDQSKRLGAIPATPLLGYFSNPLFQGRKGEWLPKRLKEACALIKDPSTLLEQFDESVRLFEARYKNYQPFHPKRHSFQRHHGESLSGGVDLAARLRSRDDPYWRKRVWGVSDDNELDFVYLDREIELGRTSSKQTPDPDTPLGETLIVDLFLANAYDRMPILGEVKVRTDQCSFYALIQSLCSAAYAATASQRERLVLFGSRDDFILSEAPLGERATIDLYIVLARSSTAAIYRKLEKASIELSAKLVASERFGERVGRIAWIRADDDGVGGLTLLKVGSFTSYARRPRARDKPNRPANSKG
jgi:hypothetical protein